MTPTRQPATAEAVSTRPPRPLRATSPTIAVAAVPSTRTSPVPIGVTVPARSCICRGEVHERWESKGPPRWAVRTDALQEPGGGADVLIMDGLKALCPDHATVPIVAMHPADRLIPLVLRSASRAALLRDDRVSIALCADGTTRLHIIPAKR